MSEIKTAAELSLEKIDVQSKGKAKDAAQNVVDEALKEVEQKKNPNQHLAEKNAEVMDIPMLSISCKKVLDKQLYKWHIPQDLKYARRLLSELKIDIDNRLKKDRIWYKQIYKRIKFHFKRKNAFKLLINQPIEVEYTMSIELNHKSDIPNDLEIVPYLLGMLELEVTRQMAGKISPLQATASNIQTFNMQGKPIPGRK